VVDDDPLTRTLMARMLARLGCQVQTLDDGMQFLECLLGDGTPERPPQHFDLVSLDNAMPVSKHCSARFASEFIVS
jgi:CheY-like chemotaxis protein